MKTIREFLYLLGRIADALEEISASLLYFRQLVLTMKRGGQSFKALSLTGSINTFEQNNGRINW